MKFNEDNKAQIKSIKNSLLQEINRHVMKCGRSFIGADDELSRNLNENLENTFEAGYHKRSNEVQDQFEKYHIDLYNAEAEIKGLKSNKKALEQEIHYLKEENSRLEEENCKLFNRIHKLQTTCTSTPTLEVENLLSSTKDTVVCMLLGEINKHDGLIERYKSWRAIGEAILEEEFEGGKVPESYDHWRQDI